MTQIIFVNIDNIKPEASEAVEVHAPDCKHVAQYKNSPFFDAGTPEDCNSAQEFFDDYNSDFYAESGQEGIWAIKFLPCSKLVKKTTVLNKMSY